MPEPQLLRESTPTARKVHNCSLCTGLISTGQTYTRDTLVYDGHIYDWLTCPACTVDDIYQLALDWTYMYEGIDAETVREWAEETAVRGSSDDQRAAKNFLERASRP